MSFVVGQRRRELGIRMALGAQRRDVLMLILRQGSRLIMLGAFLGLLGAFAVRQVIAHQLYSVTATDQLTVGGASVLLILIAVAACWLPARRAARIDPMEALRYE
jgi:ABC-type antimicrobial peptide transport system permease subunit